MTTTTEQTLREILTVMWMDEHIDLTDGPDDINDVVTVGESAINAALDAKPDNWTLRSIYADWLEAQGNPRCESQRWMVVNQFEIVHFPVELKVWTIFTFIASTAVIGEKLLPFIGSERDYPTRTAAELDLHNALVKAGEITCEEV